MSSYHGWTHAPKEAGGTDPIPFPTAERHWAYIAWTVGADIASGSWVDPGDVSGDWESFIPAGAPISASLTAGTITASQATTKYLWHAHAIASWQDTPAAGQLGLRILPASAGNPVANPTSEGWADATRVLTDGAIGAVTHDSYHAASASSITFSALVFQNTGGNLFLNFLALYIIAEAVFDTATGVFDP